MRLFADFVESRLERMVVICGAGRAVPWLQKFNRTSRVSWISLRFATEGYVQFQQIGWIWTNRVLRRARSVLLSRVQLCKFLVGSSGIWLSSDGKLSRL